MHLTQGAEFHLDRIVTGAGGRGLPGLCGRRSEGQCRKYYKADFAFADGVFHVAVEYPEGCVLLQFPLGCRVHEGYDAYGTHFLNWPGHLDGETLTQYSHEGSTRKEVVLRLTTDEYEEISKMTIEFTLRVIDEGYLEFPWSQVTFHCCRHGPIRLCDYHWRHPSDLVVPTPPDTDTDGDDDPDHVNLNDSDDELTSYYTDSTHDSDSIDGDGDDDDDDADEERVEE